MKAIIIGVNADRGLGSKLAKRFAIEGMEVYVAGRTKTSLDLVVKDIEKVGGKAIAVPTDATKENEVKNLFDQVGSNLDLAICNVGNNTPGKILEMSTDYFEQSWRACCLSGFIFGREALKRFVPERKGTILFTGASASLRGKAGFAAFNSSKGALRQLAQAMAKEYGPVGIHVGHIVVDGVINGEIVKKKRPDIIEKLGEDSMINIEGIVEGFVFMYRQPRHAWSFELDVRTYKESW